MEPFIIPGIIEFTEPEMWAVCAALFFMAMDIITGFAGAAVRGAVSSAKMRAGLGHKVMLILVIMMAIAVQAFTIHIGDLGFTVPLILPVCVYIIVMEVASAMENIKAAYPDLDGTPLMKLFDRIDDVTSGGDGSNGA